jgi:hypothetical protein
MVVEPDAAPGTASAAGASRPDKRKAREPLDRSRRLSM